MGAHQARAKLPLAVFLLASSYRVWAPATNLRFVFVGFRWASEVERGGEGGPRGQEWTFCKQHPAHRSHSPRYCSMWTPALRP